MDSKALYSLHRMSYYYRKVSICLDSKLRVSTYGYLWWNQNALHHEHECISEYLVSWLRSPSWIELRYKSWCALSDLRSYCSWLGYNLFDGKLKKRLSDARKYKIISDEARTRENYSLLATLEREREITHLLLRLPGSQGSGVWCTSLSKTKLISTYHLLSSTRFEKFPAVLEISQSVKSCLHHMALNSTFFILAVSWIFKPIILSS